MIKLLLFIAWIKNHLWWLALIVVALFFMLFVFLSRRKGEKRIIIADKKTDSLSELLKILGTIDNIFDIDIDESHLKIELINLKQCNYDLLHDFGAKNIIISHKSISFVLDMKAPFYYQKIKKMIEERFL